MTRRIFSTTFALLLAATAARGDGLLFSYEGDILPGDPGWGFTGSGSCEPDCSQRLEGGHFILEWGVMGDLVSYIHRIDEPGVVPPPPTLWVEWRFRSNQPMPPTSYTCDGRLTIDYIGILDIALMFQDAVVDNEGGDFVLGLDPDIFHTYRFESLDGENYTMSVDGVVFNVESDGPATDVAWIQFGGIGDCVAGPERPVPVRNEWDFIRYGTIADGDLIVAAVPPAGIISHEQASGVTTILVTFDGPNHVYVDDIAVVATSGIAPNVVATRRLDNGAPETMEIVLDRELPLGATTTFTFTDASGPQTLEYTRIAPDIPASSAWALVVLALACLIAGAIMFRPRLPAPV